MKNKFLKGDLVAIAEEYTDNKEIPYLAFGTKTTGNSYFNNSGVEVVRLSNMPAAVNVQYLELLHRPKWRAYQFRTFQKNPIKFDPRCLFWVTEKSEDYLVIAHLPNGADVREYWDDAFDIVSVEGDSVVFNKIRPKPDYFEES